VHRHRRSQFRDLCRFNAWKSRQNYWRGLSSKPAKHKKASGGRAPPGPVGEVHPSIPRPFGGWGEGSERESLKGKERKGREMGRKGK